MGATVVALSCRCYRIKVHISWRLPTQLVQIFVVTVAAGLMRVHATAAPPPPGLYVIATADARAATRIEPPRTDSRSIRAFTTDNSVCGSNFGALYLPDAPGAGRVCVVAASEVP